MATRWTLVGSKVPGQADEDRPERPAGSRHRVDGGIGFAIAKGLAKVGAAVVLNGHRRERVDGAVVNSI